MFAMLSKIAEILEKMGPSLLAYRRATKDTEVAAAMLRPATALQDLCARGKRLLDLAELMVDASAPACAAEEFAHLVEQQATAVDLLRSVLGETQALLATADAGIYVELVPFLDGKSGLLTRWGQQAAMSRFSTTTLFFLPAESLDRVIAIGKADATQDGLPAVRSDFLVGLSDAVRTARSDEVRDLRLAGTATRLPAIRQEIATARAGLARTEALSGRLVAAAKEAVGPEVMARLRRKLTPKRSRG